MSLTKTTFVQPIQQGQHNSCSPLPSDLSNKNIIVIPLIVIHHKLNTYISEGNHLPIIYFQGEHKDAYKNIIKILMEEKLA
jgi:hypothetical protein